MPSNKRPRKQHHRKSTELGLEKCVEDRLRKFYNEFEYAVYTHLPQGNASREIVLCIEDMFRTVYVSSVVCKEFHERDAVKALLKDAELACEALLARKKCICTGEELRTITDATATCAPYILDSIKSCPRTFLNEWAVGRRIAKSGRNISACDDTTIKRIYQRL